MRQTAGASTVGWGRPALGAALVGALLLIALLSAKLALDAGRTDEARPLAIRTAGLAGAVDLGPAPAFTLPLFGGEQLELGALAGRPVLVNFWASWCGPCRQETAVLQRLWVEYAPRGVTFVGIDVWDGERSALAFVRELGVTYPVGADPRGAIARRYRVAGVPETFLVDGAGRIGWHWLGPWSERELRVALERLVGV